MLKRMGKGKNPYSVGGGVNCAATMEISVEVTQKTKNRG
jgi:hypothetical protein